MNPRLVLPYSKSPLLLQNCICHEEPSLIETARPEASSIHLHIKTQQMMKEKHLLEKAIIVLLAKFINFLFSVKSMLNSNLIIHIQHTNVKWFNTVKKNEKMQCERNVWHFISMEPHHFSWAVSVTLLEERFVHRAKHWAAPWGSSQVQAAAPLPWAEFSSVPEAKLAVPTSSSWLLRGSWVLFFIQTHLHRWILKVIF